MHARTVGYRNCNQQHAKGRKDGNAKSIVAAVFEEILRLRRHQGGNVRAIQQPGKIER